MSVDEGAGEGTNVGVDVGAGVEVDVDVGAEVSEGRRLVAVGSLVAIGVVVAVDWREAAAGTHAVTHSKIKISQNRKNLEVFIRLPFL